MVVECFLAVDDRRKSKLWTCRHFVSGFGLESGLRTALFRQERLRKVYDHSHVLRQWTIVVRKHWYCFISYVQFCPGVVPKSLPPIRHCCNATLLLAF